MVKLPEANGGGMLSVAVITVETPGALTFSRMLVIRNVRFEKLPPAVGVSWTAGNSMTYPAGRPARAGTGVTSPRNALVFNTGAVGSPISSKASV